jgi:protocatechuate 3,4-dioxygenase beta subunit
MSHKIKGALSALCVFIFVAGAFAQARDTLVITGTVKDSAGAAVAGAIVTVGGGGGMGGSRDTTDASGAYSITYSPNFTPNSVTVTATEGTRTGRATATVPDSASGTIPLTANIVIGTPAPVVRDTLVITGTVKDSAGAAVAGAVVTVGGGMGGSARDTTDASGAYSITYTPNTTPTSVTVTATLNTTRTGRTTVTVPANASGQIPLTANITIGNAVNPTGDTVVITGIVKDSTGAAVSGAVVTAGGGGMGGSARDTTDASGAYSITMVNTTGATSITVTARAGTGMGTTGTARVTIASPRDGTTDLVTADITLGLFNGVVRGIAQKSVLSRAHLPSYSYAINGRRIAAPAAGVRANGIRIFRVEGSKKVMTIR